MNSRAGWERAREIFLDLADRSEAERAEALAALAKKDVALGELVQKLLRHDTTSPAEPRLQMRLGPYEITRRLGSGGMGEVFLGRRADGEYEREVAIKLLHAGTDDAHRVQRFHRERQTLARLDHEYIARLLDGGTSETGDPFLVMEYVDGEPADAFAARLDVREQLALFLRIGRAVGHAHERGVVHRDLKPSNILVRDDATPRLLDFGIAWTRQPDTESRLTRTGHRLFTPEYASPEQIRGEAATTSSDVFALGVLLHVFLVGRTPWPPFESLGELERSICEFDPPPPSRSLEGSARRRIAGDLDAITLQCLAKHPARRYPSVAALCQDIERFLDGRPILARRSGLFTRISRYAGRRPAQLLAGISSMVTVLALGVWWQVRTDDYRRQEELRSAVTDRIETAREHWADGRAVAAVEELDAAEAALEDLPHEPSLRADVTAQRAVFASMQRQWQEAADLAAQGLDALDGVESIDATVLARLLNARAYALHRLDPESSEAASRAALEHARAHLTPGDVLHADALLCWADELRHRNRHADAQLFLDEAVEEVRSQDPRAEIAARFLNEQAIAFARLGENVRAAERYREALDILSWHRGEGNPSVGKVRFNLGATLYRARDLEAAREEFERTLKTWREVGDEWFLAATQQMLGRVHLRVDRLSEAATAAGEALEIRERLGEDNLTARSRCLLAVVHALQGEPERARAPLAACLAELEEHPLPDELEADAHRALGRILANDGQIDAARAHLQSALRTFREVLGSSHPVCIELEGALQSLR